jgi:hypothetical protein
MLVCMIGDDPIFEPLRGYLSNRPTPDLFVVFSLCLPFVPVEAGGIVENLLAMIVLTCRLRLSK